MHKIQLTSRTFGLTRKTKQCGRSWFDKHKQRSFFTLFEICRASQPASFINCDISYLILSHVSLTLTYRNVRISVSDHSCPFSLPRTNKGLVQSISTH